jgi:DNA polymerase-3 subunit epsilon
MSVSSWLERLFARRRGDSATPPHTRWVMLDVETSGLDTRKDRLLAIAAIGLHVDWETKTLRIDVGDSFEVVLQQDEVSSKDNILLHGIGAERQRMGTAPAQAMGAFVQFVGNAPLLAFHAAFDQTMIARYAQQHLGAPLANAWLDIDHLCAVTYEGVRARALDDWLTHFGIHCAVRHQAAADTLAECELLQRIWPRVANQCANWSDVQRLAGQQRWIQRGP